MSNKLTKEERDDFNKLLDAGYFRNEDTARAGYIKWLEQKKKEWQEEAVEKSMSFSDDLRPAYNQTKTEFIDEVLNG